MPRSLFYAVLDHMHRSKSTEHYGIKRTTDYLSRSYWWPCFTKDVGGRVWRCVAWTAAQVVKSTKHRKLVLYYQHRGVEEVAVDVQSITPTSIPRNTKIMVMMDTFTHFTAVKRVYRFMEPYISRRSAVIRLQS